MYICEKDELKEFESKQFEYHYLDEIRQGFVINMQDKLFVYQNHCPHTGVELNWQDNIFLSYDKLNIQCAMHGALFQIANGMCIWGPCIGQSLQSIPLRYELNRVYLD